MVLRDKNIIAVPSNTAMSATDQPVKKKQRIDGPDIDDDTSGEETSIEIQGVDSVDCCPGQIIIEPNQIPKTISKLNIDELSKLQNGLAKRCICDLEDDILINALEGANFSDTVNSLRLLSTLQLLLEVNLQMNGRGAICNKVANSVDTLIRSQRTWLPAVASLASHRQIHVSALAARALASFFLSAKETVDRLCLERIVRDFYMFDILDRITVQKISFSLDVVRRIIEWKDLKQHPLEEDEPLPILTHTTPAVDEDNPFRSRSGYGTASTSTESQNLFADSNYQDVDLRLSPIDIIQESNGPRHIIDSKGCELLILTDSESFDTSHIKFLTIKTLEQHWPELVKNIKSLLFSYLNIPNAENCILSFLSLWENIISVKANLSVVATKPFYADLQSFSELLRNASLPSLIYTQLLSLFNEVLCYGSTLALQDVLPEESCSLAHSIVRFVKDYRLLHDINLGNVRSGLTFIGCNSSVLHSYSLSTDVTNGHAYDDKVEIDKTMLQKIVLLILKSVAVTVKEMRCDSSDSSIDSSDYNAIQDMQIVERSIRDVLKKLDTFIRNAMEFHPETPFMKILIHIFSEQDDYLIESMVCTLDITIGIIYRNSVYPDLITFLSPFLTFIEFLNIVSHNSDVLLDYLVSNETCFLLYLLRLLKYFRRNWSQFVECCQGLDNTSSGRSLDTTMSVLIRLRLQISRLVSRSLFPYNITPVLRLLEVCESLYEGNEFS